MESKLKAYREHKRQQKDSQGGTLLQRISLWLRTSEAATNDPIDMKSPTPGSTYDAITPRTTQQSDAFAMHDNDTYSRPLLRQRPSGLDTRPLSNDQNLDITVKSTPKQMTTIDIIMMALKIILWFLIWCIFIQLEFGTVYFVISLLCFVYLGTRSGPKPDKGPSAYSVFNPNCERLQGTFTAEQFDQSLRRGGGIM